MTERFEHDRDAREAAARAASQLREELGGMPVDADERVLAAVFAAGRVPEPEPEVAREPRRSRARTRRSCWTTSA